MRKDGIALGVAVAVVAVASALTVALIVSERGGQSESVKPTKVSSGLEVRATLDPRTLLFGDTVRAMVDITLDRRRVDPDSVRVSADFTPWKVVEEPKRARRDSGSATHLRIVFVLRCLTSLCAPSGQLISVDLPAAKVAYAGPNGEVATRDAIELAWPRVGIYSRTSTSILEARGSAIPWRADLLSQPAASYRVSPTVVFALLLAGGLLFAVCAVALVYFAWPRRAPAPPPEPELPLEPELSPLEQALALLEDTMRADGAADRRRALELVAEVLEVLEDDLAEAARSLAWSESAPQVEQTKDLAALVRSAIEEGEEVGDAP